MKKIIILTMCNCLLIVCYGQNVGIGTSTPAHKLDIAGRIRLQNSGAGTAGMWFDGPTFLMRSFLGSFNDNYIGIFGSGGIGWNFVMNVDNGNTGIGTTAPTAKLDVNGSFRIRQNGATAGSSLHASDALGNTEWVAPVAFNVKGYSYGPHLLINNNTWTDVNFGVNTAYNYGSSYNASTSEFTAPQNGLYHFKSQIKVYSDVTRVELRLRLRRNNVVSTISETDFYAGYENFVSMYSSYLDAEVYLNAGDDVWIEVLCTSVNGSGIAISSDGICTWFSGRLVIPF